MKNFDKIIISLIFVMISSCGFVDKIKNFEKSSEDEEYRIVDLDGNYRPVKLQVPVLNKEALANKEDMINIKENQKIEKTNIPIANTSISPVPKGDQKEAVIKYDMSNSSGEKLLSKKKTDSKKDVKPKALPKKNISKIAKKKRVKKSKSIYIQIGSYSLLGNAKVALTKNKKLFKKGKIEKVSKGNKKFYRVSLGPISNKKKANELLKQVTNLGYKDAFIAKK